RPRGRIARAVAPTELIEVRPIVLGSSQRRRTENGRGRQRHLAVMLTLWLAGPFLFGIECARPHRKAGGGADAIAGARERRLDLLRESMAEGVHLDQVSLS